MAVTTQGRCNLKYPLLLIHGVGFRDLMHISYWGRIPDALEAEGGRIYYGGQDSWGLIEDNARALGQTLDRVLAETGSEKVNILAHSKGGLDARYLASALGYSGKIASITTISTPHHGSKTIDWLLKIPPWLFRTTAFWVDTWCRAMGDQKPNFYGACRQFSTTSVAAFNTACPDAEGVYYQSYGTAMKNSFGDFFLWFPHLIVSIADGESDGIVPSASAVWTNFGGVWRGHGRRGVSHLDSVDARRSNFSRRRVVPLEQGVNDIRQMYMAAIEKLAKRGF